MVGPLRDLLLDKSHEMRIRKRIATSNNELFSFLVLFTNSFIFIMSFISKTHFIANISYVK